MQEMTDAVFLTGVNKDWFYFDRRNSLWIPCQRLKC